MHETRLRTDGDRITLAIPLKIREQLQLKAGDAVALSVENDRLIVEPKPALSQEDRD